MPGVPIFTSLPHNRVLGGNGRSGQWLPGGQAIPNIPRLPHGLPPASAPLHLLTRHFTPGPRVRSPGG